MYPSKNTMSCEQDISGLQLRFPYEIVSKIIHRLVYLDSIETLRTLSELQNATIQEALDEHILTFVVNINHDPESSISSPDGILNHPHRISRNKIIFTDLNKSIRESCTVNHSAVPKSLNCTPCSEYKKHLKLSIEDKRKVERCKMVIVEIYNNRDTCLACDQAAGHEVLKQLVPEFENLADDDVFGPQNITDDQFLFHLQIYKLIPRDLDKCRLFGQRIHLMDLALLREEFTCPHWVNYYGKLVQPDDQNIRSYRYVEVGYGESPKKELVVQWLNQSFGPPTINGQPVFRESQGRFFDYLPRFADCVHPHLFLDRTSSIDVFFYISGDTLRDEYIIANKVSAVQKSDHVPAVEDVTDELNETLILTKAELKNFSDTYYKPIIWARILGPVMEPLVKSVINRLTLVNKKYLNNEPDLALDDIYSLEMGQRLMKRIVRFFVEQNVEPLVAQYDFGYDDSPFFFLGRFQIHKTQKLYDSQMLERGKEPKSFSCCSFSGIFHLYGSFDHYHLR